MSMLPAHRRFFDVWSRFYGATPLLSAFLNRMQAATIARLGLPGGSRVLDLGCGPGNGLELLALRRHHAFGGDLSQAMARRALRHAPVARLSADALPFRAGTFDGLVCTNSFHHHPDAAASLAEMRRVLRRGGRLAIVDPAGDTLGGWAAIRLGEGVVFGLKDVHVHGRAEWRSMLARAGFSQVIVERAGRLDPRARSSVFVSATAV